MGCVPPKPPTEKDFQKERDLFRISSDNADRAIMDLEKAINDMLVYKPLKGREPLPSERREMV